MRLAEYMRQHHPWGPRRWVIESPSDADAWASCASAPEMCWVIDHAGDRIARVRVAAAFAQMTVDICRKHGIDVDERLVLAVEAAHEYVAGAVSDAQMLAADHAALAAWSDACDASGEYRWGPRVAAASSVTNAIRALSEFSCTSYGMLWHMLTGGTGIHEQSASLVRELVPWADLEGRLRVSHRIARVH